MLKVTMGVMALSMVVASAQAGTDAGLILTGIDTLSWAPERGFDFVTQRGCTTSYYVPSDGCNQHFTFLFTYATGTHELIVSGGWGLRLGKTNLDSIAFAPSDSVFQADGYSVHVDSLRPDRLQEYIGDVYVFKSGRDPRPTWDQYFYFKIKILALNVVDSVNHHLDFVFLWACQLAGSSDIRTTGLDTFDIVPITEQRPVPGARFSRTAPYSIVVPLTPTFSIPVSWRGTVSKVAVYDVKGRLLRRVEVPLGSGIVELGNLRTTNGGTLVVRGE